MRIDKPEGEDPRSRQELEQQVTAPSAPLPPEPPQPLFGETEMPLARERERGLGVHPRSLLGMVLIGGATLGASLIGRAVMKRGAWRWYRKLDKPSWTPPEKAFGIVWPILYAASAVSAWRIWRSPPSKDRSAALGAWTAQIASNAAWSPIFFGKRHPKAALADLGANVGSVAAYTLAAGRIDRMAGLLMAPYLAWVTYAAAINASVVRKNA